MKNINIFKLYRHFRYRYITLNNIVILVALIIGASWAWGSIGMMQRNFGLQKEIDSKTRQRTLGQLEVDTLAYEQKYYQSSEYKELSVREHLGLANAGEKVLVLPPNSASAKQVAVSPAISSNRRTQTAPGNFQQWTNFLFGGNSRDLQK